MISLLLTLFISLFSVCPSNYKVEDQHENNQLFNAGLPVKNAFIDDSDSENVEFVYSVSDLASQNGFFDLRNYFEAYYPGGLDIDDNDDNMPLNTFYTLPIRICYVGSFTTFDYAAGFPYLISETWTVNYVRIMKLRHVGDTTIYEIGFMPSENYNINSYFSIRYQKTSDFDYVIGTQAYYNGTRVDMEYAFVGRTGEGNQYYPAMYDIMKNVGDRGHNEADYLSGYNSGLKVGRNEGYQNGYQQGLTDADYNSTASTIFNGIFEVGLLPVNVFLTIFNFEVFGINIAGIISGLLTLSVVVIIVRFLLGGKKDD